MGVEKDVLGSKTPQEFLRSDAQLNSENYLNLRADSVVQAQWVADNTSLRSSNPTMTYVLRDSAPVEKSTV